MPDPASPSTIPAWLDWLMVALLVAVLGWTTVCLGGYLAETMVWTSRGVTALAVLGALRFALARGEGPVALNLALLLPLPFLAYALGSLAWLSPARWLAWREWLPWLHAWVIFAVVLHGIRRRAQTAVLVGAVALLGLTGVAMAAWQRFVDPAWIMIGVKQTEKFADRSAGMFGSPNSLAALLDLVIPVAASLLLGRALSVVGKVACAWLLALFLFALVLTGSRGGWISTGLALFLLPLVAGGDWRRRLKGFVLLGLVAGVALAVLFRFNEPARDRIQPFLEGRFEASRPIIWRVGLRIWQTAPWLGTGTASYNVVFDQFRPKGFLDEPEWTHNDYVNNLSDFGAIGFALWFGAGAAALWLGWRAVARARRNPPGARLLDHWRWKLGLWLGLVAFATHLLVDFFTRIPALACLATVALALLLRDDERLHRAVRHPAPLRALALAVAAGIVALAWIRADPLFRGDAERYWHRRSIDRIGAGEPGDLAKVIEEALPAFRRATAIDPGNGQAWADQAYGTQLLGFLGRGNPSHLGLLARESARRAIEQCPIDAEFWVRQGSAEDMLGHRREAEASYQRALQLAPNTAEYWFYYAFHLGTLRGRESAALEAIATCLSLDPSYPQAIALRERLSARHQRN